MICLELLPLTMIKKTLYFGNPCSLKKKDMQLHINYSAEENKENVSVPIEDIGLIMLDNPNITLTNALLVALNENNTAVITCNSSHMPYGLILPMFSNTEFQEKFSKQVSASKPLLKNLWKQTVEAKIKNQAELLARMGMDTKKMKFYMSGVSSGDKTNIEGRAAAYYWENLFENKKFRRNRFGQAPNNMLNYGYAILRAVTARSLVESGLLPCMGIHHKGKYNSYCLADDIMEPFRPFVDLIVLETAADFNDPEELTPGIKKRLLQIPVLDISIEDKSSPLMVGMQRTTASLVMCFEGSIKKIIYPEFR